MYCWATRHCQQYKNNGCSTTILLWRIYVAGNNNTCIVFHVWCSIYLCPILTKLGVSRRILVSPQDWVSCKSVRWERRRFMLTDWMDTTKLTGTSCDYASTRNSRQRPCKIYWNFLTFMASCIVDVYLSTTNEMQRYTILFIAVSAVHVSSGFPLIIRSSKNVHAASGTSQTCLVQLRLTHARGRTKTSLTSTRCCMYSLWSSWWWAEKTARNMYSTDNNK